MGIIAAYMVPHPPLIIPQVGRGGEKEAKRSLAPIYSPFCCIRYASV